MTDQAGPTVAVIVVTWNGRTHLRRCLDALSRQTYPSYQIVVVDNASSDGSAEMAASEFPSVRLIRNERNLGFAAANNIGINATDTPYVATLNNDTAVDPGWLSALVRAAEADIGLGSVASRMVFDAKPETINSCGIALDPAGIAWDLFGGRPAQLVDHPREVFGPCAGAALYRRAMLDDVGLFDPDFFAYLEDVDLAWRARLRGWRCMLAPDALVRHAHAGTLGEGSPLKRYLLARNKVWTVARNAPAPEVWRWLPIILVYDVGAAAFGAWRHGDWASVRGRLAGLWRLPRALEKRRTTQARRTASTAAIRRSYAALAAPWDVPKRYRHLATAIETPSPPRKGKTAGMAETPSPPRKEERVGVSGPPQRRNTQTPSADVLGPRVLVRRWLLRAVGRLIHTAPRATPPPSPRGRGNSAVLGPQASPRDPQSAIGNPLSVTRVVVLRPDHLGDVLLSRPALELLRAAAPTVEITVVAGPWGVPSLQGLDVRVATFPFPGFVRTASFSGPPPSPRQPATPSPDPYIALLALAARLRRKRYDAALILRPDHWWGALACAAAGIRVRVGYETPETAPFLTHALPQIPPRHAADSALTAARELLHVLGIPPAVAPPAVTFAPSPAAVTAARGWLRSRVGEGRPIVAVHPGAGAPLKTWPAHRWADVVNALGDAATVILTGGPDDAALVAAIHNLAFSAPAVAQDLSWDMLAALYQQMDLTVGMDSGPLHLSAAVGTPTVRVYGPTDPQVYGPAGTSQRHHVVYGTLPCRPCGNLISPPCGFLQDPPCLAAVPVEDVVAAARNILVSLAHRPAQ